MFRYKACLVTCNDIFFNLLKRSLGYQITYKLVNSKMSANEVKELILSAINKKKHLTNHVRLLLI